MFILLPRNVLTIDISLVSWYTVDTHIMFFFLNYYSLFVWAHTGRLADSLQKWLFSFLYVDLLDGHQKPYLVRLHATLIVLALSPPWYFFWSEAPLRVSSAPSSHWDLLIEFSEGQLQARTAVGHPQTPIAIHWSLFLSSLNIWPLFGRHIGRTWLSQRGKWSVSQISVSKL